MVYNAQFYYDGDPVKNPIREGFSKLASEQKLARARFAQTFITPQNTIADVSCGSGYLSSLLQYRHYTGVDHPDMISLITKESRYTNNSVSFIPFDFENSNDTLDLETRMDIMISFETIEHLHDPEKFLYHLNKNMKQEGLLLLSTPNNPWKEPQKYTGHIKEYSLNEMHGLLEKGGFNIEKAFAMGIPFGLIGRILKGIGIKTYRYDSEQERGKLSKMLDKLPLLRKVYCTILPYNGIGDSSKNMIIVATKR